MNQYPNLLLLATPNEINLDYLLPLMVSRDTIEEAILLISNIGIDIHPESLLASFIIGHCPNSFLKYFGTQFPDEHDTIDEQDTVKFDSVKLKERAQKFTGYIKDTLNGQMVNLSLIHI